MNKVEGFSGNYFSQAGIIASTADGHCFLLRYRILDFDVSLGLRLHIYFRLSSQYTIISLNYRLSFKNRYQYRHTDLPSFSAARRARVLRTRHFPQSHIFPRTSRFTLLH